jgi:hypothetical protein
MKKIIEFTKNWKHRNLLHIVGGFLIGVFLSLLFAWYVSLCIVFAFANYWEYSQKSILELNTQNATLEDSSFGTDDTHETACALLGRLFYSYDNR